MSDVATTRLWPWPVDPDQAFRLADEALAIGSAALAEVGVQATGKYRGREHYGWDDGPLRDALSKAQSIAYITLGIAFDWLPEDEYRERRVALGIDWRGAAACVAWF